jgi:hypothetical protein
MASVRKSEFACCESGPRATVPTRRFFLTMQSVAKASTESGVSVLVGGKKVGGTEDLVKALDYRVVKIAVYSLTEESRSPFHAEPDFDFISSPFSFQLHRLGCLPQQ